jgi:hypothetical protein
VKRGVCIIECIDSEDPGSEGRVLKEIFNLMQVDSVLVPVTSIKELFSELRAAEFRNVHISTHGAVSDDEKERFRGWWTPNGTGSKKKIAKSNLEVACTTIVSTACKSGEAGFAKLVTNDWGSKYYIAPTGCPTFYNAALFSHVYYHKLFKIKRNVIDAFESYDNGFKNPHGFTLYQREAT